jgi:ligand-binding sensor domain-containing protein
VDYHQLCLGIVRLIAQNSLLRFGRGRAIARDLLRMLFGILCCFMVVGSAAALDPTRSIAQMRHSRWTLGDGAPGNIRAIVQGRDGYLWLGTATGLYRFDGIIFERIVPVDEDRYRSPQVTALLAARNGDIWVGYDFGGVAVFRGGVLKGANPAPPVGGVNRIVEGRDDAIWFAVESKGQLVLSRLLDGRWSRFGPRQGVPDTVIADILSTSEGIYLSAHPTLLQMRPGDTRFTDAVIPVEDYTALAESPGGRLWLWASDKIRPVSNVGPMYRTGPVTTPYVFPKPAFDHDGNLWLLGQDSGLGRLSAASLDRSYHSGAVEMFTERQGLTASLTLSMLEDREGNIWVGTESGLDRFSPSNIVQPEQNEALASGFAGRAGGSIFIAGLSGVYRIGGDGKPVLIFPKTDIGVLCGDGRRLLVVSMQGKWMLDIDRSGNLAAAMPIRGPLPTTCAIDAKGEFWTGMDRVYRVVGDNLQPVGGAAGITGPTVTRIRSDGAGGVVFARVAKGISRLSGGVETRLWRTEDHVIGSTRTMVPSRGGLLIVGNRGLARYDGRRLASLTDRSYPFLAGLTGLLQTPDGATWVIGASGIVRMTTARLDSAFAHPGTPIPFERFGYQEDFRARSNMVEANDVGQDAAGRLWFATNKGLAMIDPRHLSRNRLPPTVQIRSLDTGGAAQTPGNQPIAFAAGTDHVRIAYTALSITNATANRFRYRIEGIDRDWVDAGTAREALYTNLGPGKYRFQVIAANNDGVWNREGAALTFTIAPRFYQTYAFMVLCIVGALLLIWLLYRRRVRSTRARSPLRRTRWSDWPASSATAPRYTSTAVRVASCRSTLNAVPSTATVVSPLCTWNDRQRSCATSKNASPRTSVAVRRHGSTRTRSSVLPLSATCEPSARTTDRPLPMPARYVIEDKEGSSTNSAASTAQAVAATQTTGRRDLAWRVAPIRPIGASDTAGAAAA